MFRPTRLSFRFAIAALLLVSVADVGLAQGPSLRSPGMPGYGFFRFRSQTDRFSSEFNPAIGVVIDSFADYLDVDSDTTGEPDGWDLQLRLLELTAQSWIDPNAWAYAVLASEEGESPEVEEAAVIWTGWDSNATFKAGRFFVDFGKQMQSHVHDLRTIDRPAVLREFLGEELGADGVQLDNWFSAGDATAVRYSVGVFADLVPEGHGEEEEGEEPEAFALDRKGIDDLGFTGRLTALTDVGQSGALQFGGSFRYVPDFAVEFENGNFSDTQDGLSNLVAGLDATYSHTDDTGEKVWTAGAEFLMFDGDVFEGELDTGDPTTATAFSVEDDSFTGWYGFVDYQWTRFNSAGLQVSMVERPGAAGDDLTEFDLYFSHLLSEFQRLRLQLTFADDDATDDSTRIALQYTVFFGPHAHGINW